MFRKLETLANLSIIVAALMFCATIAKDRWLSKPASTSGSSAGTESPLKGSQLKLSGVKWDQADKTLVMALSTQCHFCQESAPFYRELTASPAVKSKRVAVVTVFPQEQSEAESFVKHSEIRADSVLSMPLQTLGASSTPTLLLVNRAGKVEKLWIGVLSPSQQKDLLSELTKLS
jgi:hypothetical protein